ncbi:MAG: hypothetical protein ABEJ80_04145 [Halarchaeum sp.]
MDEDLGRATIVYENADGDTVERTVPNEHIAYVQDHWILKTDGDESGVDTVRRIPIQRVYHVERDVEEFREEVETLRDQVESVADDLRSRLLGGRDDGRDEGEDVVHIDVEEADERDDDSS